MNSQAELAQKFERIEEISSIMSAMKSLALVETKKLARFIERQRLMLANIETAAADFQHFFSIEHDDTARPAVLVVIGSERGFCGNFNERLIEAFDDFSLMGNAPVSLVAVGSRLWEKYGEYAGRISKLEGPTVTEEIPTVLDRIMEEVSATPAAALYVLSHQAEGDTAVKQLIPFEPSPRRTFLNPPILHLPPEDFFAGLLDQYLLASLYGLLCESLAAESHQRLAHMEQALDHLGETLAELTLKRNALRQEKIIEEIEVILSSRHP